MTYNKQIAEIKGLCLHHPAYRIRRDRLCQDCREVVPKGYKPLDWEHNIADAFPLLLELPISKIVIVPHEQHFTVYILLENFTEMIEVTHENKEQAILKAICKAYIAYKKGEGG